MEKIFALVKEIDCFMKKKLTICNCKPCKCTNRMKNEYFKEMKDILARANEKWFEFNSHGDQVFRLNNP